MFSVSVGATDSASVEVGFSAADLIRRALDAVRPMGVAAVVMTRPIPGMDRGEVHRGVVAASSPALLENRAMIEAGPSRSGFAFEVLLEGDFSGWSSHLRSKGYGRAHVVRIPVAGSHYAEFVFLAVGALGSDAVSARLCQYVLESWPHWRSAIRKEFCILSGRECEALQAVSAGLTGAEAAGVLGCTERTFRAHIDSAKRKLQALSAPEAAHRAQLLCAF